MDSSNKSARWIVLFLRITLGAIFVYAAWEKLRLPWQLFAMSIDSYQLLPPGPVEFIARTLPAFELALGVLVILGVWLRWTSAVMSALLVVFFSLIVRAALKGQEISCGCFGPGETISWKTMLRDGSMLAGSLLLTVLAWISRRRSATRAGAALPLESTPPEPAGNLPPAESR